jgi:hypothetical protein
MDLYEGGLTIVLIGKKQTKEGQFAAAVKAISFF